uniref:hypothetical protein n=1 Tax=uncultured Sphingomonas sp. TaxID=158754 RepID=UPI0035CC0BEB
MTVPPRCLKHDADIYREITRLKYVGIVDAYLSNHSVDGRPVHDGRANLMPVLITPHAKRTFNAPPFLGGDYIDPRVGFNVRPAWQAIP